MIKSINENGVYKAAEFSEDGKYRYRLWRCWVDAQYEYPIRMCVFIMLNPSTANELKNDPTVERCERYARSWGYSGLVVCNLFALRSTDPNALYEEKDPIGPENDEHIRLATRSSHRIVCAWGNHGSYKDRSSQIKNLLITHDLYYLKLTGKNEPGHPLYLKKNLEPKLWDYK